MFLHRPQIIRRNLNFPFALRPPFSFTLCCGTQNKIKTFAAQSSSKTIRWNLFDDMVNDFYFLEEEDGLKPIFHWCKGGTGRFWCGRWWMVSGRESICCSNTTEMGSSTDRKLHTERQASFIDESQTHCRVQCCVVFVCVCGCLSIRLSVFRNVFFFSLTHSYTQ